MRRQGAGQLIADFRAIVLDDEIGFILAKVRRKIDHFGGDFLELRKQLLFGLNLLGVNTQLTQAMWGGTMIVVMVLRYVIGRYGLFKPKAAKKV